jgi:hypothetical protein
MVLSLDVHVEKIELYQCILKHSAIFIKPVSGKLRLQNLQVTDLNFFCLPCIQ